MSLRNAYLNRKFRTKIIINFLIINLIISISVGVVYYYKSAGIIEDELTQSANYAMSRLKLDMNSFNLRIMEVSDSISTNATIRKILLNSKETAGFESQLKDYIQISNIYSSMPYYATIYKIRLYLANSFDDTKPQLEFLNLKKAVSTNWYARASRLNGKIFWTGAYHYKIMTNWTENLISCTRVLKDYNQADRTLAYVCIDVKEKDIRKILAEAEKAVGGDIYLLDENNQIVSCQDESMIGRSIGALDGFTTVNYSAGTPNRMKIAGEESLVLTENLPSANWRLVTIISMQNFVNKTKVILVSLMQISGAVFLLSILLALLLSFSITGRIKKLIDYIRRVDVEKYEEPPVVTGKDEISELIHSFNNMVYENHVLVNEVYVKSLEKKNAEIRVLQAQINPHFLYNALDTANWMAQRYNARDIMKFLKLLSNFYRLSLSVGKSVVSIETELEHVKTYVEIQKIKSNDEIEAEYQISPDILPFAIPKMILQPIVENAIIHGLQESEEQCGTVRITGAMSGGMIRLAVKDDGVGMMPDKLAALRLQIQDTGETAGSYGLRNVLQRIKLFFGENSSLSITSEYGKGTQIEISFPAVLPNELG